MAAIDHDAPLDLGAELLAAFRIGAKISRESDDAFANMRRGVPEREEVRLAENHRSLARGFGAYRMTHPAHICGRQCRP